MSALNTKKENKNSVIIYFVGFLMVVSIPYIPVIYVGNIIVIQFQLTYVFLSRSDEVFKLWFIKLKSYGLKNTILFNK